jgi:hypothetical protein
MEIISVFNLKYGKRIFILYLKQIEKYIGR